LGARAFAHLTTGIAQTEPGGTSYFTALEALLRCGITIFATWAKPLHVATTRIGGARARSRAEEADQSPVFRDPPTAPCMCVVLCRGDFPSVGVLMKFPYDELGETR